MAPTSAVRAKHADDGAIRTASTPREIRALVAREANAAGFSAVRIARIGDLGAEPGQRFLKFIADGRHGDMDWLEAKAERRQHPNAMWSDAKSAIVLGLSYAPEEDPLRFLDIGDRASISVYAARRDYHDVVKPRLKRVARALQLATSADVKVFVDTAPLMEKPLAALSGLGWQGKHTNLVSREHGSWLYLGIVLSAAEIEPDEASAITVELAGAASMLVRRLRSQRPISSMRAAAFPTSPSNTKDRSRASSALPSATAFSAAMIVSPSAPGTSSRRASHDQQIAIRPETQGPRLADLLALDDAAFRERFAGTPIKRSGIARFLPQCADRCWQ
jgi:epoxyqueuosine reductase